MLPLFDPPRHDSAETIRRALNLGVNVKMITGCSDITFQQYFSCTHVLKNDVGRVQILIFNDEQVSSAFEYFSRRSNDEFFNDHFAMCIV